MPDQEECTAQETGFRQNTKPNNPMPTRAVPEVNEPAPDEGGHAAKHRRWNTFLQAALVIIGAVYSFFSFQQWQATSNSANAAVDGVKQARESANIDRRAWVLADGVTTNSKANAGEPIVATLEIKNAGRTPANNFKTFPKIIKTDKGRLKDFMQSGADKTERIPEGAVIVPNTSIFIERTVPATAMKEEDAAAIKNEKRFVFIAGTATYDLVGGGHGESGFCYIYDPRIAAFTPYAEGNYAR
jgi:hypothetical protein